MRIGLVSVGGVKSGECDSWEQLVTSKYVRVLWILYAQKLKKEKIVFPFLVNCG